jgi:antitoxin (DNA-binding transcriptional repressor) of toxin-antitoxin stability system
MDVSVADARNRLSELLRSVEAGEDMLITRNGKPVLGWFPRRGRAEGFASEPCVAASI